MIQLEDDNERSRKDVQSDEADNGISEIVAIEQLKGNCERQTDRHTKIEISKENQKHGDWKDQARLRNPSEGYRPE